MNKRTALYEQHLSLGAKIIPFAGYEMPVRYTGDVAEHLCVRKHCGLFDVSHMGEFLVKGPKAFDLLQWITSNDVSKLPIGKAQYSCLPNGKGGIVDDLIVYHLDTETYLVVVNASNIEKDWNWFVQHNQTFGAELKNLSDKTGLLALSGPAAQSVLQPLTDIDLSKLAYYELAKGTVCGIENILVATTGYTGERTFEIFMPVEHSVHFWNMLLENGKQFGIQPVGLGARDTLRLEMGYMLYGNDIDDTTSPLEAG
ncbi:MAG: glycine cleavage system aminomethyltransferase GcvT, partial [Bacteroidia bacterium]|nr:glycine cleavage system aminomethyltransferase GcvT [Bacteroidia bacterium]